MYLDPNPQPKKDNRQLVITLALIAGALLIFAAVSRQWLERPNLMHEGIGFGPRGCYGCALGGGGGEMSNGEFVTQLRDTLGHEGERNSSKAFAPMGWATLVLSLIAGLSLLWGAFVAYQNKRPVLPISPPSVSLLSLMLAMVTACVFVATKPGGPGFVGISVGFMAFGGGLVTGIIAAQMLAKRIRPVDPDLLDDAMNPDSY